MKTLVALLLVATCSWSYAQGTVNFQNRNTTTVPIIDAPISYGEGGPAPAGRVNGAGHAIVGSRDYGGVNAKAGLYGGPAGTPEDQLMLLVPAVGFRSGPAAGYVNVGSSASRSLLTVQPGAQAVVQIRAWDVGLPGISSYEDAISYAGSGFVYAGKSALMIVTTGGGGSPPSPPADLIGLQGFTMPAPEPSTFALAGLAVGMVCLWRKRK